MSFFDDNDKHGTYRKEVQNYAGEEKQFGEKVKYGLFLGTEEFIERVKGRYLSGLQFHGEIPQQKHVLKERDLEKVLKAGAEVLQCHGEEF